MIAASTKSNPSIISRMTNCRGPNSDCVVAMIFMRYILGGDIPLINGLSFPKSNSLTLFVKLGELVKMWHIYLCSWNTAKALGGGSLNRTHFNSSSQNKRYETTCFSTHPSIHTPYTWSCHYGLLPLLPVHTLKIGCLAVPVHTLGFKIGHLQD